MLSIPLHEWTDTSLSIWLFGKREEKKWGKIMVAYWVLAQGCGVRVSK